MRNKNTGGTASTGSVSGFDTAHTASTRSTSIQGSVLRILPVPEITSALHTANTAGTRSTLGGYCPYWQYFGVLYCGHCQCQYSGRYYFPHCERAPAVLQQYILVNTVNTQYTYCGSMDHQLIREHPLCKFQNRYVPGTGRSYSYDRVLVYRYMINMIFMILVSIITFTFQLNSWEALPSAIFWTSRGHRCRPFSPRYVPSIFIAHRVQHSHCSSIFIECCQLTLSCFPLIIF